MSAAESNPRYVPMARFPAGHQVLDLHDGPIRAVDYFNTRSAAEYAAKLLNSGVARVDSHAVVGCKVVVS